MIPQDHQNRRTQVSCLLAVKLILSMVENSGFGLRVLIVKRVRQFLGSLTETTFKFTKQFDFSLGVDLWEI